MNKDSQFLLNLGIHNLKKNNLSEAELYFKQALENSSNLNLVYCYLIPVLIQQSKDDDALFFNQKFLKNVGESEHYFIYEGILNLNKNFLEHALKAFKNVLKINGNNYDALVNVGIVLNKMHLNQDALVPLQKAISIKPNLTLAYQNIGKVYDDEGDYENAINCYQKALSINPQDYDTIHNLSLIQLILGDYENGWKNYDLRWKKNNRTYKYPNFPKLTSLENLMGKKILIWHEQGLGDTIQFSRYVNLLIEKGAAVTFEVQEPLYNFFKNNFNCQILKSAKDMQFDFQLPLLSLPKLFGMNLKNTQKIINFFKSKTEKNNFWYQELSLTDTKLNIGIAISGNPKQAIEYRRKIDLILFIPILKYAKIYLVQKEISKDQQEILSNYKDMIFLGDNRNWEDFEDTSAIVNNLDMIISIDTSLTHLSCSMNKNTVLLLSQPADWRWGLNNQLCPTWYDNLEIIRQHEKKNWDDVIKKLINKIRKEYSNKYLKIN